MSDQDRLDRAERIRQMREGRRESPPEEDADGADPDEDGSEEGENTSESSATGASPDTGSTAESAPESEGHADEHDQSATEPERVEADQEESEGGAEESDEETDDDDVVASAIERVTGASAYLPGFDDDAVAKPAGSGATDTEREADTGAADDDGVDDDRLAEGQAAGTPDSDEPETARGVADGQVRVGADRTRVLEFTLGDERYCLDIEYIEEIVKDEQITRVPNTPAYVEGVVDLRGQITTILNPKVPIDNDDTRPGDLIVVFDAESFDEQGHLGWIVDDVRQVTPVSDREVNDPPTDDDYVNGIIDRDDGDEFVIWTTPELAIEEAT